MEIPGWRLLAGSRPQRGGSRIRAGGAGRDARGLDRAGRRFDIPVHEAPDDHDRDDDRDPQRRAVTSGM